MDDKELMKLLKPQLANMARKKGIYVAGKNTKSDIVRKILSIAPAPIAPAPVVQRRAPAPKAKKITNLSINNLYSMNLQNIKSRMNKEGWRVQVKNKDTIIKAILGYGTGAKSAANIGGGGKIINKFINAPPAKGACRSGRLQISGTCWFQSLMNPLLLSELGRDILQTKLEDFKKSNNMKKWTNINACPLRLSGTFFWSYIDYKLKEDYTNMNYYKKVMKGSLFENERLIRNLKLKNNASNIESGSIKQILKFFNQVFKNDYSMKIVGSTTKFNNNSPMGNGVNVPSRYGMFNYDNKTNQVTATPRTRNASIAVLKVMRAGDNFKPLKTIHLDQSDYKLFGAYIASGIGTSGHAMTGYLCGNGNYMFYDSNNIRTSVLDWTTSNFWSKGLPDYMTRYFGNTPTTSHGVFFYARVGPKPPSNNAILQMLKNIQKPAPAPARVIAPSAPARVIAPARVNSVVKLKRGNKVKAWLTKVFKPAK